MTTKGNGYTEQNLLQLRYLLIVRQSRFERGSRSLAQKTYTIGIISNIIRPRLLIQCRSATLLRKTVCSNTWQNVAKECCFNVY